MVVDSLGRFGGIECGYGGLEPKILKCLRMLTSTASQTRGRIFPLGKRVLEGRSISDAKSVAQAGPSFGISEAACWQDVLA